MVIEKIAKYFTKITTPEDINFHKQISDYLDPYVKADCFYTFCLCATGFGLYISYYSIYDLHITTLSCLTLFSCLIPWITLHIANIAFRDLLYKIGLSICFFYGSYISGGIFSPIILLIPFLVMNIVPHTLLIRNGITDYVGLFCASGVIACLLVLEYYHQIPRPVLIFNDKPFAWLILLYVAITKMTMIDHLVKVPVTKLKNIIELNKKMIEASEAAIALNKSKATFMAQMSHELRTPLNAIIGFSEIMNLEMLGSVPDAYREYCLNIHYSGKHLLTVVNNILDMVRLEEGRYVPKIAPFSPNRVLIQIFALMQDLAKRKNISFNLHSDITEDSEYMCDEQAVKQILINIVSNSIKYCRNDTDIDIFLSEKNGYFTYEIRDKGKGFSSDVLNNFGMPFNLGYEHLSDNSKSTGLGLSITKALVETLGGTIRAFNSNINDGAVVQISLPSMQKDSNKKIA